MLNVGPEHPNEPHNEKTCLDNLFANFEVCCKEENIPTFHASSKHLELDLPLSKTKKTGFCEEADISFKCCFFVSEYIYIVVLYMQHVLCLILFIFYLL